MDNTFVRAESDCRFDVAIVGGGAMGLALATFLRRRDSGCQVCVVERDPAFTLASTPRASGGLRRLFALPMNIRLSDFGIRYFDGLTKGPSPEVAWTPQGYLFVAPPSKLDMLARNLEIQMANGVAARMMKLDELKAAFPSLNVSDLGGAVHSPEDGWVDPPGAHAALMREATEAGATLIRGEVVEISTGSRRATKLRLADGATIRFDQLVNAAGAWAPFVCRMLELEVPIEPMRRFEHEFESLRPIEPFPYIKDTERLAFRPKGRGYTGGLPDYSEPGGINFDIDHGYFDRVVRPALAHRVPALSDCRHVHTKSGLYDQNRFDGNPIIGTWSKGISNFHLAAGFSGHGLMHVPAAALGLAELLLDGAFKTFDLTCFSWDRIFENRPAREVGII